MALELFRLAEGLGQLVDDAQLLGGQLVGVGGIDGGQVAVVQMVGHVTDGDGLVFVVDLIHQQAVIHAVLGTAHDQLTLQLEEDHGDGLVHSGGQQLVLLGILVGIGAVDGDLPALGVGVLVNLVGKDRQGAQGDAVAGLDGFDVVIVDGVGQHDGHHGTGTGGGAHPEDVVVAPLDIAAGGSHQGVHDDVRTGTTVEDIADDVHVLHGQALDGGGQGLDDGVGLLDGNDGGDQVVIVFPQGAFAGLGVQQLVDEVGVILGHEGADPLTGVLAGNIAADLHHAVQDDAVPVIQILVLLSGQGQLGDGVVNEGSQFVALPAGEGGAEELFHLGLDLAGAGVEDVEEGVVLAVDIGHEMLGALGQVQNGVEPHQLLAGCLNGGVLLGQHPQITELLIGKIGFMFHRYSPSIFLQL